MPASAKKRTRVYAAAQSRIAAEKEKILLGLRKGWSPSGAARFAGCSRTQYFKWKNEDPIFAAAIIDAQEEGLDGLEDVATGRARRKSDVLMMFMLNGGRPEKFKRKNELEITKPVEVRVKRFGSP